MHTHLVAHVGHDLISMGNPGCRGYREVKMSRKKAQAMEDSHPVGCWKLASLQQHMLTLQELCRACTLHQRRPGSGKTATTIWGNIPRIYKIDFEWSEQRLSKFHTWCFLESTGPFPLRSKGTAPCSLAPLNKSSTTSLELFFLGGPTICWPLRSDPPAKNLSMLRNHDLIC